jgi:hypothetical protein
MVKTLVIILSETRAHELTFNNFKKNVIDTLNADLCLCIGIKTNYDYNNPFYKLAKYKFLYDEPEDFADSFEYAYNILKKNKYEKLENINTLFGKIDSNDNINQNIKYYGENIINIFDNYTFDDMDDDEIIIHSNDFPDDLWKNKTFGIKKSNNDNFTVEEKVITYKKPLYWREFLKIKNKIFGGINDDNHQHPGSSGILIFFRWFLLQKIIENDLLNKYDRFIITRSDFIYQLPHPTLNYLDENNIWIPDGEHNDGYTDRHVILSKYNIESYLNILNNIVIRSNEYFIKMREKDDWNIEKLIKFNLKQNNVLHLVREFPYIMYSVRNINGSTKGKLGNYNEDLGYYIKYISEYEKSSLIKNEFDKSMLLIDDYYKNIIHD